MVSLVDNLLLSLPANRVASRLLFHLGNQLDNQVESLVDNPVYILVGSPVDSLV